jgi:hypothetical protein
MYVTITVQEVLHAIGHNMLHYLLQRRSRQHAHRTHCTAAYTLVVKQLPAQSVPVVPGSSPRSGCGPHMQ